MNDIKIKDIINIAIDGPAGAGKSTIAKELSKELGILYLDTGAMYRACAYYFINKGFDVNDKNAVESNLDNFSLSIKFINDEQHIFVDNCDITDLIRTEKISKAASDISAIKAVRLKLVALQREIASSSSCVLDGRDIGTYVLPNADLKIYLNASLNCRAKRRFLDLQKRGESTSLLEVKREMDYRDRQDKNREFAPLGKADDAVEMDCTELSIKEVCLLILEKLHAENLCTFELCERYKSEHMTEIMVCRRKLEEEKKLDRKNKNSETDFVKDRTERVNRKDSREELLKKKIPEMRGLRSFVIFIIKMFMKIFFPYELHDTYNAPSEGPALLVANHVAVFDVACMTFPVKDSWIFWVNKKEVSDSKWVNWFYRWWQTIVVDTDRIDFTAVRQVMTRLKQKQIIGIFPQSTRIKTNERLRRFPPRTGILYFAGKYDAPIYPVMIDGTFSIFQKTHVYFGKAIKLKISKEELEAEHDEIGFQIMNQLFSLAGRDYYKEMGREDLRTEKRYFEFLD